MSLRDVRGLFAPDKEMARRHSGITPAGIDAAIHKK